MPLEDWFPIKNASGSVVIPPYSVVRSVGFDSKTGSYLVDVPNANSQSGLIVTGEGSILPGGYGKGSLTTKCIVSYSQTDFLAGPQAGTNIGSKEGSYTLHKNQTGFTVTGGAFLGMVNATRAASDDCCGWGSDYITNFRNFTWEDGGEQLLQAMSLGGQVSNTLQTRVPPGVSPFDALAAIRLSAAFSFQVGAVPPTIDPMAFTIYAKLVWRYETSGTWNYLSDWIPVTNGQVQYPGGPYNVGGDFNGLGVAAWNGSGQWTFAWSNQKVANRLLRPSYLSAVPVDPTQNLILSWHVMTRLHHGGTIRLENGTVIPIGGSAVDPRTLFLITPTFYTTMLGTGSTSFITFDKKCCADEYIPLPWGTLPPSQSPPVTPPPPISPPRVPPITPPPTAPISTSESVTSAVTVTMEKGMTYYADDAGTRAVLYLPEDAAEGDEYEVIGRAAGGWEIAQRAGMQIKYFDTADALQATALGITGKLRGVQTTSVVIKCLVAATDFRVTSKIGPLTKV